MGNEEAKPGEAETVEVLEVRRQIIGVYAFEEEVTQGLFTSWKVKFLVDGTISNYTCCAVSSPSKDRYTDTCWTRRALSLWA